MANKNKSEKPTVMSPAEIAKKHKAESEERKEAAKYRFPEGEDYPGKVIRAEDTLSQKKKSPCYEIEVQTKEKNSKGKRVNIIVRFMKNEKSMGFFYAFLELAGADLHKLTLSHIKDLEKQREKRDELIGKLLEKMEDDTPKIVFNCAHQSESTFNNYYVNECDAVLAEAKDDSGDSGEEEDSTESESNGEKDNSTESEESTEASGDDAFDDDDD